MKKLLLLWLPLAAAWAQENWNRPVEPFRIAENIYYVGASDLTSYLITTPAGHILLDSGMKETVPLIRSGVEKLGFKLSAVKTLLATHAHYDHCGGMAELKRLTRAPLAAGRRDVPMFEAGGRGDFHFGDRLPFEPVKVDRPVDDGDAVELGGVRVLARLTPGHTKGCTTWTLRTAAGKNVVFVGSASVPGYRLKENYAGYPEMVEDYRKAFRVLESLECDVFLGAHGRFFDLAGKRERMKRAEGDAFVDPDGYRRHIAAMKKAFLAQLQ